MSIRLKLILILIIVMTLVVGCGKDESALLSAVPTTVPATATPIQPTKTSQPTATSLPTSTPISTTQTPTRPTETEIYPTTTLIPSATTYLPPKMAEIQAVLENLASNDQFSGAVLIAQDGEPILQAAYGLANHPHKTPNQIDTKFNLGSMDKMFTAVAVLQLVERSELTLQDTVGDHLSNFAITEIADMVSIHQLLTHTSGMGNYFDSPLYEDIHDQIRSISDYLPLFIDTPLQYQPGSRFVYSNSGFIVLGLIIEEITGQSYYDYVRENIFEPSGMLDTACYELDAGTPNLASGYTSLDWDGNDTGQITDNNFVMPMRGGSAGGGFSTAPDMFAFRNALLGHQLLSPESTGLLMSSKVELWENVQYAYGFFDRTLEGYRIVGHGGGFPGICSIFGMNLDLGYTTVVLSNSDDDCMVANEFIMETLLK